MCLVPKNSSIIALASTVILLSLMSLAQEAGTAAKIDDTLQAGTVESVLKHGEGRVFDIVSRTIIYDNYPFYDITIRAADRAYLVRYEAMSGYYPAGWQTGKQIKFRREKGQLLILRYDGEFVPARIL